MCHFRRKIDNICLSANFNLKTLKSAALRSSEMFAPEDIQDCFKLKKV